MAVTFTATPEPGNSPPRVRLDLDTGDVARSFSEIIIRRDGVPIRAIAPTGSSVSVVYDYDCPFGVPVTYTVEASDGGFSLIRNETWPNLSGWSTYAGTPAVAAGKLTTGTVERSLTPPDRIVLHDADQLVASQSAFQARVNVMPSSGFMDVQISGDGTNCLVTVGGLFGSSVGVLAGTGDLTVTNTATGCSIETTAGTWTLPVSISAGSNWIAAKGPLPGFELYSGTAPATASLSDSAQLDVDEAWLIHPIFPDLSISIDANRRRWEGLSIEQVSASQITRAAQSTVIRTIGRERAVVVTNGNRAAGEWILKLFAPRLVDRDSVDAITRDQSPLLLRMPPSFEWDIPDDWYSVGNTDDDRVLRRAGQFIYREYTLPLTPVDPPPLVQGAEWTWADVVATYATWADVLAAYPTWLDLVVGPPS